MLKNPSHPGEITRDETLPYFRMSVAGAARVLLTDRQNLIKLLNGQRAMTPDMALKIEKAFGVSAQLLINAQANWDLAQAQREADRITSGVERQTAPAAA
jgi:addiction module HigA family antidote